MASTYVLPAVQVFQDFQLSPTANATPLSAHIAGGHAQVIRYAEDSEQSLGALGTYDPITDTAYTWPNRAAGGLVDPTFTKLFVKDAILKYFFGSGVGAKVAGKSNQVRLATINLVSNGISYPRNAALYDRDVRVGDVVKLYFGGGSPVTVWSYVSGFGGDSVAMSLGTTSRDTASNAATHGSASATGVQIDGPVNAVEITSASASAYDPYPTGQVTETYTVVVTQSSTGGDFRTAKLRVISASGLDDQAAVTPSIQGAATAIGTHGVTATFDSDRGAGYSESATDEGLSPDDLLVGQKFLVTAHALFTQTAAPTASGTYTGTASTTYVITVTRGNKFATAAAQIRVSTTGGDDVSGPTNVTSTSAVAIGNYGVSVAFAGIGLAYGDRFYVPVTAAGVGQIRTLSLGNSIPSSVADNATCDVTLFIKQPTLQLSANRVGSAPLTNYTTSDTEITVQSGATAYESSWTDGGVPMALPVESDDSMAFGQLFVEYRAWLSTLSGDIGVINDPGELNDLISGPLDPVNPLKWGVFKSLAGAGGSDVLFTSAVDPTSADDWADVLSRLIGKRGAYGLVPLTRDTTVWSLYQAHVADQSSPENAMWRVAWFNLSGLPTIPIVSAGSAVHGHLAATTSDGNPALATITDDPNTSGTQYTIVMVPGANALFKTNGVTPGDIVRAEYSTDGFGGIIYEEFVIDAVLTEESLRLVSGPVAAVNIASKIEVWRNLTLSQEATAIAGVSGSFGDFRIRAVWPDQIETGGTVQEGYHLCATLAGLRSGVLPQQGLTRVQVPGYSDVPRTTRFNKAQLDTMAVSGTWIVTQNDAGTIYTRHAVTTGSYADMNKREEMIISDVDSISYQFMDTFDPFIGITNITPTLLGILRLQLIALIDRLRDGTATPLIGGQLVDAQILALRQHLTLRDNVVCIVNLDLPAPFNNMLAHLVIPTATAATAVAFVGATNVLATTTTSG